MIRVERRLTQPRWLAPAVPVFSLVVAFGVMTLILLATHHPPGHTFRRLFDAGFVGTTDLNNTLVAATPLLFTGLCAAAAFRSHRDLCASRPGHAEGRSAHGEMATSLERGP